MALNAGAVATFTSKKIDEYVDGKVYIEVKDMAGGKHSLHSYNNTFFHWFPLFFCYFS